MKQNLQPSSALHDQRTHTRLLVFVLALTAFAAAELVSLGVVSAERTDVSGMEILDATCTDDGAQLAC
jgi:hypothetical protein